MYIHPIYIYAKEKNNFFEFTSGYKGWKTVESVITRNLDNWVMQHTRISSIVIDTTFKVFGSVSISKYTFHLWVSGNKELYKKIKAVLEIFSSKPLLYFICKYVRIYYMQFNFLLQFRVNQCWHLKLILISQQPRLKRFSSNPIASANKCVSSQLSKQCPRAAARAQLHTYIHTKYIFTYILTKATIYPDTYCHFSRMNSNKCRYVITLDVVVILLFKGTESTFAHTYS